MTRDERLAAGWVESWAVKAPKQGTYSRGLAPHDCGHWTSRREAFMFSTRRDASDWLLDWHKERGGGYDLSIVRVWRRKKPKAPAPLKVGDKVTVRGTVAKLEHGTRLPVQVLSATGYLNWFRPQDVERDGKAGA